MGMPKNEEDWSPLRILTGIPSVIRAIAIWYWGFLRTKPLGAVSLFIIFSFVVIAIFAPLIAPYEHDQLFPVKDPPAPRELVARQMSDRTFVSLDFCDPDPTVCVMRGDEVQTFAGPPTTVEFCNENQHRCVLDRDGQIENKPIRSTAAESPNLNHWLGTDNLGRSVLSRAIYGARISMYVGLIAVLISTGAGTVIGLMTGFFEGKIDMVTQRIIDTIQAFPALILALSIVAIREPSINNALAVISLVLIPTTSRVVRGTVLSLKQNPYVEASRALGASNARIMFRHILPNAMVATITFMPFILNGAITSLTALDFLGLGLPPGSASLGELLNQGKANLQAPWLGISSFLVIAVMLSLLIFIGEGVRDAFDPRKTFRN